MKKSKNQMLTEYFRVIVTFELKSSLKCEGEILKWKGENPLVCLFPHILKSLLFRLVFDSYFWKGKVSWMHNTY